MNFINGNKFAELHNGMDIIYSKIDDIGRLILPNKPFKLITHNGDLPVSWGGNFHSIIQNPFLIKWYAQNVDVSHPKIQAIPIGLDRSIRESIYTDVLNSEGHEIKRDKLFYFRHWGDSMVKPYRDSVRGSLISQGFEQEPKRGITEYLTELKSSMFCPCPNGNGIDTHSLWECIYMGCVPIVEWNINTEFFSDLPILFITDWSTIKNYGLGEYLYKTIRSKSLEKSDFNYWNDIICS